MSDAVAVPLWLVLLAGLLAAWAFYEHLLMPALRWLVMHPANQVIDQMSTRLRIGIRPFQRTRRQALDPSPAHRSQGPGRGGAILG